MLGAKLFDYNSSFSVIRTNPKLSGNLKITIDSNNGVTFNSMDANSILSNNRFKNFNITGENTFASDIFNFFDKGKLSNDIIFQVAKFTNGDTSPALKYSDQYDFFYGAGASTLIDKNYTESFSYFAPLWIKNEIPDYFIIVKIPGPISYPYSKNVITIDNDIKYKIVQNYDSINPFTIAYGKDSSGGDIIYSDGDIITGYSNYTNYTIISGTGLVVVFDELNNLDLSDDVETLFNNKILPNSTIVKTFDLTENSKIGKYIRGIFNDKQFSKSPIDINWGLNAYTYFNGASVKDGIYSKKGEILSEYFSSDKSDGMIDFESYITSGFYRNSVICTNLLNLEFLFDDDTSDNYSINRYAGFYVSKNDISKFRLNGEFLYQYKDLEGNANLPKPTRDDFGYYYNNSSYEIGATSGVRIFYEDASGFLPGSDDVNILDPYKMYYITDKNSNFYSLKRDEGYTESGGNSNLYTYGPYNTLTDTFGTTGSTGSTTGSLVLQNTKLDLFDFSGFSKKIGTIPAELATISGKAYAEIEFLKNIDFDTTVTFKIYHPLGYNKEGARRFDVINSAELYAIMIWREGAYYSSGANYYFNIKDGTTNDIATGFSSILREMNYTTMDVGVNSQSSIMRLKDSGIYGNENYSISVFDDYIGFTTRFKGEWVFGDNYLMDDIVIYNESYYTSISNITSLIEPNISEWVEYNSFTLPDYIKINGNDVSASSINHTFVGGTDTKNNRIVISSEYESIASVGNFINTKNGYSIITGITKYVDSPYVESGSNIIIGFNDFLYKRVINIENVNAVIDLSSDKSVNIYGYSDLNIGVFSFFDTKEFDFDFWSSDYGYTPTPETYKYFQLKPGVSNTIIPNVPYIVKQGQIYYNSVLYSDNDNNIFYGATGYSDFDDATPDLAKSLVVFPLEYSDINYTLGQSSYSDSIGYNSDLNTFNGFLGIQDMTPSSLGTDAPKLEKFQRGKLDTEYDYLKENYTTDHCNVSRIVPFINKWIYSSGSDARGNKYRLNSSPAFSPTNFSPSFDRNSQDPRYVTHEWFLLEQPPRKFPISEMQSQNSYLSKKIDLAKARSCDSSDVSYLSSYFTVESSDYDLEFSDNKAYTKELFTPFVYNKANGFYETLFRGVKIVLKKKSLMSSNSNTTIDEYVSSYRGYEDYKFAAILRPIDEIDDIIQDPVKYEIIENTKQKFILFVCDILMNDYKAMGVGYTGGTGGETILDYTLLYSLSNKEKLKDIPDGGKPYGISDIKLSVALDLSLSSGSKVDDSTSIGIIWDIPNPTYDTDLREEVHTFFLANSDGATGGQSSTGIGSFYVPGITPLATYPWPTGVGPSFLEFGKVATGGSPYTFDLSFSTESPITVPLGPKSIYENKPVFQVEGGDNYYDSILQRISLSSIANRINASSPYILYNTYVQDTINNITNVNSNIFSLSLEKPSTIIKSNGSRLTKYYGGPKTIGTSEATSYVIQGNQNLPSTLLRYSGGYEPLFRKVIHFDRDKSDTLTSDNSIDLSFRNCNFSSNKINFGVSKNLEFTKVALDKDILRLSASLPEGPVYPLVDQFPISRKDFNIFSSSWDPGYYETFTSESAYKKVAGTRSMLESKSFFGSKMMMTPYDLDFNNYITLEISRNYGNSDIIEINKIIDSYTKSIQYINTTTSGTGIGNAGTYLSGVDYNKIDLNILPNCEIVWQYYPELLVVKGIVRLDKILRRYLLNDGIKQVFIDNIISEFGVGNPDSIDDDINEYIDLNVSPLYTGNVFNLFVKKDANIAEQTINTNYMVRGDMVPSDTYKNGYYIEPNFKLINTKNLIYSFEYPVQANYNYSLLFNFEIIKI